MTNHGDGFGDGNGTYNELSSSFVDLLRQCRSSGLHSPTKVSTATGSSTSKANASSFTLSQLALLHQTLLSTAATTTTTAAASSSHAATAVAALIDSSCSSELNSDGSNIDNYDSFLREFLLKISFREGREEDATEEGGSSSKEVFRHLFFSNGRIRSRHDASIGKAGTINGSGVDDDDDEKLNDEQMLLAIQFLLYHYFGFYSPSSSESSSLESSKLKRMTTGLTRFLVPYILMTKVDDWNDDDDDDDEEEEEEDHNLVVYVVSGK